MKKSLLALILVFKFAFCGDKLTFENLFSQSIKSFPNIQIKKLDQQIALADLKYARAEFFPRIYLSANSEYSQKFDDDYYKSAYIGDESIISSTGYQNSASIVLRYDIFKFYQDKYKYDAAKSKVSFAINDECDYVLELGLNLLENYYKAINLKHQIAINSQIYSYYKTLLLYTKRLNQAGLAPKTQITQYEITLSNTKAKLLNLLQESQYILGEIEFVSGVEINDINQLADLSDESFSFLSFDDTFRAKKLSDEIMQKELLLKSAKRSYFPTISLYAKYDFYGFDDEFSNSYKQTKKHGYKIGLNFSFDLFDGGRKSAQISNAKAELQKSRLSKEIAQKEYEKQIRSLKAFIDSSFETKGNLEKLYDESNKALNMANRLNENSQIPKTELLIAQIENLQNKLSLNEYLSTLKYNIKKANLLSKQNCDFVGF